MDDNLYDDLIATRERELSALRVIATWQKIEARVRAVLDGLNEENATSRLLQFYRDILEGGKEDPLAWLLAANDELKGQLAALSQTDECRPIDDRAFRAFLQSILDMCQCVRAQTKAPPEQ